MNILKQPYAKLIDANTIELAPNEKNGIIGYNYDEKLMIADGYKKLILGQVPALEANQYASATYSETETEILVAYEIKTIKPTPVQTLEEVVAELIQKLNDKNIIP